MNRQQAKAGRYGGAAHGYRHCGYHRHHRRADRILGTNVVVTYVQARNQLELESRKHEWDLISKAITSDLESTTKMLSFYVNAGLVRDDGGKMADFLTNHKEDIPTLPSMGAIACYSHNQEGSS